MGSGFPVAPNKGEHFFLRFGFKRESRQKGGLKGRREPSCGERKAFLPALSAWMPPFPFGQIDIFLHARSCLGSGEADFLVAEFISPKKCTISVL